MTSGAQTFTLTNTGGTTANISSISITGANANDFVQTSNCGSSLAAGARCTIAVMFTPNATGTLSATLSIADNASGSPQTVSLSGSGSHDVVLTWTESSSGVTFNVYRGTTPGGESSTPLNSAPIYGNTYADSNVTPGVTYYYYITAVGSNGAMSARSSQTSATVP